MLTTEHELLQQAQQGNYDAFADLQAALEPATRRFIRRLIGYADSEDDIVQTVFFALYRHLDRIDPVEKLRPYVFRMIRNKCYDELRARGKFQQVSMEDEATEMIVSYTSAANIPETEEVAHWLLLQLEVREAMEKLPELQRQTLILYAEEDLTYAEIAQAMNTNVGTVKSRLHHAKTTLKRLVRPETVAEIEGTTYPHALNEVNQTRRETHGTGANEESQPVNAGIQIAESFY